MVRLAWLDAAGSLDIQVAPADRITRARVRAYAKHLEGENASGTMIASIIELKGLTLGSLRGDA